MRHAYGLLACAAALVLPLAAAQVPGAAPMELLTLEAEALPGPLKPLQGVLHANVTARVSCLLTEGTAGIPIAYSVTSLPSWAHAAITPATEVLPNIACQEGWLTATTLLNVSADETAPAFEPATLVIEAVAGNGPREARAETSVDLVASFYSILDVRLDESMAEVAPGGTVRFPLVLTNAGNGETRVTITAGEVTPGIEVGIPEPFVLGARDDDARRSIGLEIPVTAAEGGALTNKVHVANLLLTSAYAEDGELKGDESTVSLLVTVRGETLQKVASVPGAGAMLALLAVGLAAWAFRR